MSIKRCRHSSVLACDLCGERIEFEGGCEDVGPGARHTAREMHDYAARWHKWTRRGRKDLCQKCSEEGVPK